MSAVHVTLDEAAAFAKRIEMALAEAGYPDAVTDVAPIERGYAIASGWTPGIAFPSNVTIPNDVQYKAMWLAAGPAYRATMACYECWELDPIMEQGGRRCQEGDCAHGNKP